MKTYKSNDPEIGVLANKPGRLILQFEDGSCAEVSPDTLTEAGEVDAFPENLDRDDAIATVTEVLLSLPSHMDKVTIATLMQSILDSYAIPQSSRMELLMGLMSENGATVLSGDNFMGLGDVNAKVTKH